MSAWTGYRLEDFIPFTGEVYFRLLESTGEAFWPLHLLTVALGSAALILALTGHARPACLLTAPLWAFIGIAFFIQCYAELNWAGHYLGWAFLAQAAVLAVIALLGRGVSGASHENIPALAGTLIAAFGLIGYPLLAPLTGHAWHQAETFGIHPDPTAVTTLGLALICLRGSAMWTAAVIPALWTALTALTLLALDAPWAIAPCAALGLGLAGLVWKSMPHVTDRQAC